MIDKLTYHFGGLWLWLPGFILDLVCPRRWEVYERTRDGVVRRAGRCRLRSDAREIARVMRVYFPKSVADAWVVKRA